MSRMSIFNSPFLLGFDQLEELMDTVAKSSGEGYPPYNIEHTGDHAIRITLAVAGFARDDLSITLEASQLIIRGKQREDDADRAFLHRGIAGRQFVRKFVLADGMEVSDASMEHGLLHIDLVRPETEETVRTIDIR